MSEPEFDVDPEPGTFQCADCQQFTASSHYYESASGAMVHEADPDKRADLAAAADAQRVTLFDAAPGEPRPSAMTRETIVSGAGEVVATVDVHPGGSWGTWSGDLPGEVHVVADDPPRCLVGVVEPPPGILVPPEIAGFDVEGVMRYVAFVGGHLDGESRPIALHGRTAIEDGSTYERVVPVPEAWRYSAARDRFELIEEAGEQ